MKELGLDEILNWHHGSLTENIQVPQMKPKRVPPPPVWKPERKPPKEKPERLVPPPPVKPPKPPPKEKPERSIPQPPK